MRRRTPVVRAAAAGIGLVVLGLGIWALVDPLSFYERLATYPPYNRHLLHDIGAFQVGVGATLFLAAFWKDALLVALVGSGTGLTLHFVSHVMDRDLGGRATDPLSVGLMAPIVLGAAFWHATRRPARKS
jgi:hypothetical protein